MTTDLALELSDFAGRWRLSRTIINRQGGPNGRFEGRAEFSETPQGLDYLETGQLILDGHAACHAERRYLWHGENGQITVRFADGRPFHSFDPRAASASHWCDPDMYDVSYGFEDWPIWTSTWTVSGPRKAYQMTTRYTRDGV